MSEITLLKQLVDEMHKNNSRVINSGCFIAEDGTYYNISVRLEEVKNTLK